MLEIIRAGILGLVVGDAVGVPVEFYDREVLKKNPVTDMREFGTHHQPKGTWSDDSSMTFCAMDSLTHGYDPVDMMEKFCAWMYNGAYTPWGCVFDRGGAVTQALGNYKANYPLWECGGRYERSNGNGSLMRILPMVFYQYVKCNNFVYNARPMLINPIHEVSALTHAHPISMIGCGIYAQFIAAIIECRMSKTCNKDKLMKRLQDSWGQIKNDYIYNGYGNIYKDEDYVDAFNCYNRLFDIEAFSKLPEYSIDSSGYVVSTLEAAMWCFLNTESYQECILKAVNLGKDTDTVAAVAGSFAGIYYGTDSISQHWLSAIVRRDWIEELIEKFIDSLSK